MSHHENTFGATGLRSSNPLPTSSSLSPSSLSSSSSSLPWWKQRHFYYACGATLIVVILGLLSKWSESDKQYSRPFMKKMKQLLEQSTRWNSLAQQDTNPILQLTHCNYALCCAQIARGIASDRDIETITGVDINELINYLEECQSYCIKNIGKVCPNIKIDGVYSYTTGWN